MKKIHAHLSINGIVQGVGFRPFIHKRVSDFCLTGKIRNTSFGVVLDIEGEREKVEDFTKTLVAEAPPLAEIYKIETSLSETLCGYTDFSYFSARFKKICGMTPHEWRENNREAFA